MTRTLREAAEFKLRGVARDEDGDLPKVIRGAFQTASKEVETAVEVLIADASCSSAPPAVGYLRGRAQAKRDEAPNASNPAELESQADLLERAAAILEE